MTPARRQGTTRLAGCATAHRHRQGRHGQDDRRGRPRARPGPPGQAGPAGRGRGPAGDQPDLRRHPARAHRGPHLPRRARRRDLRAVGRGQGSAAGVPPDLLQARSRRWAAREVRGRRLRHDDRPRRPRRPAHRQGLRGRAAAPRPKAKGPGPHRPTTPWSSTHHRRGGSCGSSTSTPRSPTSPRWARSAARPTRSPR